MNECYIRCPKCNYFFDADENTNTLFGHVTAHKETLLIGVWTKQ